MPELGSPKQPLPRPPGPSRFTLQFLETNANAGGGTASEVKVTCCQQGPVGPRSAAPTPASGRHESTTGPSGTQSALLLAPQRQTPLPGRA